MPRKRPPDNPDFYLFKFLDSKRPGIRTPCAEIVAIDEHMAARILAHHTHNWDLDACVMRPPTPHPGPSQIIRINPDVAPLLTEPTHVDSPDRVGSDGDHAPAGQPDNLQDPQVEG